MCEHCTTTPATHSTAPVAVPEPPEPDEPETVECGHCGHAGDPNDMYCAYRADATYRRLTTERTVCSDCCFTCGCCSESFYGDSYGNGGSYCLQCYEEHYTTCDECGCELDCDSAHLTDEGTWCDRHVPSESEHIHPYSHKPRPIFHGGAQQPGRPYFGIEVEAELPSGWCQSDVDDSVADAVGNESMWYAKEDSSLSNGVEFVSHPGTLKHWEDTGFRWADKLKFKGYRAWDTTTCGIHVHASRNALTDWQWFKVARFFTQSPDIVATAARRVLNTYCRLTPGESTSTTKYKVKGDSGRYEALNFTNEKTVEFRIFRSTLSGKSILRNVYFCAAVIEFARTCGMGDMHSDGFRRWLAQDSYRYIGGKAAQSLGEWFGVRAARPERKAVK